MLTTIALPHDWCNYEAVFTGFKAKYPKFKTSKACINFRPTDPLPAAEIKKVVRHAIEHFDDHLK